MLLIAQTLDFHEHYKIEEDNNYKNDFLHHINGMKTIPIWQDIKLKDYSSLDKDIETDILIIGGGITGINLLYALKDDKRKITLVERNKIGMGVTNLISFY